jgi:HEAT repeat protein
MSSVDTMISVLQSASEASEKIEAIKSLGYSKNIRALDAIVELLDDSNPEVRSSAIWAIGKYKNESKLPKIIPKIKDEDEQVRATALKTLAKFTSNPEILAEILSLLDDSDPKVRKTVLETIVEFDTKNNDIVGKILDKISDPDKAVSLKAIELAGDYIFKDTKVGNKLIELLVETQDFELQMALIDQLAKIDIEVKEFLLLSLKGRKKIFIEDILGKDTPVDLMYRKNSPLVMKVRNIKDEIEILKKYVEFLTEKNQLVP